MFHYQIKPPVGQDVIASHQQLRTRYAPVISKGMIDFFIGDQDSLWLELRTDPKYLNIVRENLANEGYPIVTGGMHRPTTSFLTGLWRVSVTITPGHNRSKTEKLRAEELKGEFAREIARGEMSIEKASAKNVFIVKFEGASLPDDFRKRANVAGPARLSAARPANYYYGPKQEVTIP